MFPSNPMSPAGMSGPAPVAPATKPGTEGAPDPKEIKSQLVGLLKQAKQMAEQNGLDWNEISAEVSGKAVTSSPSVPHPPKPEFQVQSSAGKAMPMMGGGGGMPGMMG